MIYRRLKTVLKFYSVNSFTGVLYFHCNV